jgi:hypothetical protein
MSRRATLETLRDRVGTPELVPKKVICKVLTREIENANSIVTEIYLYAGVMQAARMRELCGYRAESQELRIIKTKIIKIYYQKNGNS